MTAATRWWWVRHAPIPDGGARIHGQLDVDCDCGDLAAFEALAEILPGDAVWVISALKRTRQTFEAIHAFRPAIAEPLIAPDFNEQNFGRWQGLNWDEMQANDPEGYRAFWRDPTRNAPPDGESFADVMARVAAAISPLNARLAGRDIVVIGHGGSIRAAVALALRLAPPTAMAVVVDNLSLTRLDYVADAAAAVTGGAWRVRGVNAPSLWPNPSLGGG
ncbi:MAG: histidine phosphatase family protein [Rhodospirillales bacterium]|jgi:alpha-ribazole phosphatase|nr:histidine phosphatase family protein [Rhodospirillales bacterium]